MRDIKEYYKIIEGELGDIAERGLNTSNIESAYKLIDMYKDLKNTEYWDTKCEYYMAVLDEMQDGGGSSYAMDPDRGYSGRRHRDSRGRYTRGDGRSYDRSYDRGSSYDDGYSGRRGRYSRGDGRDEDYDRYMEHKQSYRSGDKSSDCKQKMIDALERHMDKLTDEIGEMGRDAECQEERDTIMRYVDKLKRMM